MKRDIEELKLKYPNIPEHCLPIGGKTKSKNPTNQLQKDIIEYVKGLGAYAMRINTQGTYSEALGKYIHSGSTKGVADILICFKGYLIACEVKYGKDKQRPDQITFQQMIQNAGGNYMIASSMDSFKAQIHEIIDRFK